MDIIGPVESGEAMSEMPEFLTVEEAAALLRIGRTSAYALTREWRETGGRKGLPVIELGRQLRVPRAALEKLHASVLDPTGEEAARPGALDAEGRERKPRRRRRRWES
jgi:excisionase family DNA binding protein